MVEPLSQSVSPPHPVGQSGQVETPSCTNIRSARSSISSRSSGKTLGAWRIRCAAALPRLSWFPVRTLPVWTEALPCPQPRRKSAAAGRRSAASAGRQGDGSGPLGVAQRKANSQPADGSASWAFEQRSFRAWTSGPGGQALLGLEEHHLGRVLSTHVHIVGIDPNSSEVTGCPRKRINSTSGSAGGARATAASR